MKFKSLSIPSVLESHNSPLNNVTTNKYDGLKIRHEGEEYIIGRLAMLEGSSPHKVINCAPAEIDYQLLMKASLVAVSDFTGGKKLNITTGFPFSTFQMNEDLARKYIKGQTNIITDGRPYGKEAEVETTVDIESVNIIPELIASTTAVRSGEMNVKGGVFVISLGYGTLEMGMSTNSGFIQRTFNSGSGLRFAIKSAMEKLQKDYYLGMRNEHQFDESFKKGVIMLNRRRIDLTEVRKVALQEYYKDVISPLIQNTWTDDDFSKANTIVLVGGGALYNDLVNSFYDEFNGILNIEIPDDPLIMASLGYSLHSKKNQPKDSEAVPVGIDIGNANTVASLLLPRENNEKEEKSQDQFYSELVEGNGKA